MGKRVTKTNLSEANRENQQTTNKDILKSGKEKKALEARSQGEKRGWVLG